MRFDSDQARYTQISDRYEISHELGRGGMAVVYLARQTELDRWVALKELHPEPRDASVVRRFLRESRLAGSLSHPNIVTVLDFFEREGVGYIAMEYVPRGSLRPYVGTLTLAQTAGVLEGILAALTCAEHGGIVHRDLKPENVMITWDGRVKLTDFGIAKATGAASLLTAAGTTLGTPHYMAPEQAMAREVGPWTDLYSVGCMAYELFTGQLPFADTEAPTAILLRHVNDVPPPPITVKPDLDPRLSDWICGLLEKDPARRPGTAAAAWEALEEIVLAIEGPRWRRASALPQIDGGGEVPGPFTPPPSSAVPGEPVFRTFDPAPHASLNHPQGGQTPLRVEREPSSSSVPGAEPESRARPDTLGAPTPSGGPGAAGSPEPALTVPPRNPPDPAPPAPRRRGRRAVWAVTAATLAGATAAAAVVLPGDETPPPTPPEKAAKAPTVALDAGPVRLTLPDRWQELAVPVAIPGLRLTDGRAAAPPGGGAVLAGIAPRDAHNPALLSGELLDALGLRAGVVPDRAEIRLGRFAAYRYEGLRPRGLGRAVTVFAAPTTAGVATVACIAPLTPGDCERAAESLEVRSASGFALGPDRAVGDAVDELLTRLDRALRRHGDALRAARGPSRQAAAAKRIAAAYGDASAILAKQAASPADEGPLEALLRATRAAGAAYGDLAAAADAVGPRRYRTAASRARAAERDLTKAVEALKAGDYDALSQPRPRTIPPLRRPRAVQPGPTDPGPSNPGPSNPGPSNPGPSDPGPSDPGPSDPGPSNPDPVDPEQGKPEPDPIDPEFGGSR